MAREGRPGGLGGSRGRPSPAFASRVALRPLARGLPPYVLRVAPTPTPSTRRLIEIITQLGQRLGVEPAPAFATPKTPSTRSITTYLRGRRLPRRRPPPLLRHGRLPRRPAPDVGALAGLRVDRCVEEELVGPVEEGDMQIEAAAERALGDVALRRPRRREGPDGAPRLDVVQNQRRALDDALDLRG